VQLVSRRILSYPDGSSGNLYRTAMIDVTERVRQESALAESHHDLEHSTMLLRRKNRALRQLSLSITRAVEDERRRMASVLHDHLQQLLFAARLRVKGQDGLAEVQALLAEALDACRTLSAELSPSVLYDQGLVPALQWLANEMEQKYRVHVALSLPALQLQLQLQPEAENALFSCAREGLFNIVKHAGVSEAELALRHVAGTLRLTIRDEGSGFDTAVFEATEMTSAVGLRTMIERIDALRGDVEIDSKPGRGTKLSIVLPLDPDAAAQKEIPSQRTAAPAPAPRRSSRPPVRSA
jgi:signal transduction histidine kinase